MTNMSYCMFENTDQDIQQCINAIESGEVDINDMSSYEKSAFMRISESCKELVELIEDITDSITE